MIWIILAAGLGANLMAAALLFRRLRRDLDRQLRDMRAERNSEWILHALKEETPGVRQPAVWAVNGSGLEPAYPPPVRRKKHLGLYIGGAVAALVVTLGDGMNEVWRAHRVQLVVAAIGAAATTTVTLLPVTPKLDDAVPRPPFSTVEAPTADTAPPGVVSPVSPPTTGGVQPIAEPGKTASVGPTAAPSLMSLVKESAPVASPSQPEPPAASNTGSPFATSLSEQPVATPSPSEQPASTDEQPSPAAAAGLCANLTAVPILDLDACVTGGG